VIAIRWNDNRNFRRSVGRAGGIVGNLKQSSSNRGRAKPLSPLAEISADWVPPGAITTTAGWVDSEKFSVGAPPPDPLPPLPPHDANDPHIVAIDRLMIAAERARNARKHFGASMAGQRDRMLASSIPMLFAPKNSLASFNKFTYSSRQVAVQLPFRGAVSPLHPMPKAAQKPQPRNRSPGGQEPHPHRAGFTTPSLAISGGIVTRSRTARRRQVSSESGRHRGRWAIFRTPISMIPARTPSPAAATAASKKWDLNGSARIAMYAATDPVTMPDTQPFLTNPPVVTNRPNPLRA